MSFTDDDLKRLSNRLMTDKFLVPLPPNLLTALLARLEAAETYAKRFSPIDPEDDIAFENWRKSCGKAEG